MKKENSKTSNGNLIGGRFQRGTKVAKLYTALKSQPRSSKELRKLDGPKFRSRVYGLRRLGRHGKPKFTIDIDTKKDVFRLVVGKRAA